MKTAGRILVLAVAASVSIGLVWIWSDSVPPPPRNARMIYKRYQRPRWPERNGIYMFLREVGLFAGITFAGRKILRLRLSD